MQRAGMWLAAAAMFVWFHPALAEDAPKPEQKQIQVTLHWITDSNGCKVWDSRPAPNESVTWSGPCLDGYADGKGTLVWFVNGSPHATYNGEMKAGHYDGHGVQTWPNGARYDGDWRNDRAHGQGSYRGANGQTCTGNWVDGCFKSGQCLHAVGAAECPQ
jgi:hypothetical protein